MREPLYARIMHLILWSSCMALHFCSCCSLTVTRRWWRIVSEIARRMIRVNGKWTELQLKLAVRTAQVDEMSKKKAAKLRRISRPSLQKYIRRLTQSDDDGVEQNAKRTFHHVERSAGSRNSPTLSADDSPFVRTVTNGCSRDRIYIYIYIYIYI